MAKTDARYRKGLRVLKRIHRSAGVEVLTKLGKTAPDLSEFVIAFAFGDIYSRRQLSLRERQIATVASVATLGFALPQLKSHINGALNLGITQAEIVEILMQMAVYAGFPAALNAVNAAGEVFAERRKNGATRARRLPRKTSRPASPRNAARPSRRASP